MEEESRLVVAWSRVQEQGLTTYRHKATFQGDGNVLKLDCAFRKYTKDLGTVHLKPANFIVSKLYLRAFFFFF